MKLKIWNELSSKEYEPNQLFLKLEEDNEGIDLVVVDHKGNKLEQGNILGIDYPSKCIVMYHGLNETIPLKTDFECTVICITDIEYIKRKKQELNNKVFECMLENKIKENDKEKTYQH